MVSAERTLRCSGPHLALCLIAVLFLIAVELNVMYFGVNFTPHFELKV